MRIASANGLYVDSFVFYLRVQAFRIESGIIWDGYFGGGNGEGK